MSSTPFPTPPERSLVQRYEALRKANATRQRRSRLKRDLKASRVALEPLLINPPEWLLNMKIHALLCALPKYGRVKVNKLLSQHKVSPTKTVGGLSQRQRNELVRALAERWTSP